MYNFITVTDIKDPRLDVYARLTEAQLSQTPGPKAGLFIAESPKVIERALDAGCKPVSVLIETNNINKETRSVLARCPDVPVYTGENKVLAQLTGYKLTRGLLCAMERPALSDAERIIQSAQRLVVLEDVVNPTNLGAIFRSAAALGMDGILLTPGCSDPFYRRCARVSMGTVFQVPWAFWDKPIGYLRELGFQTAAMALCENTISIDDTRLKNAPKLAIVLGTEGEGLTPAAIAQCDYTVKIPMYHGVDSLNVAAASAVAFWEIRKKEETL